MKKIILAACCALLANTTVFADKPLSTAERITELENQMLEMQKTYNARLNEMQSLLKDLKSQHEEEKITDDDLYAKLKTKAEQSASVPPNTTLGGINVSAILGFNYYHDNSDEGLGHMREEIDGFSHHHHEDGEHEHHHHGYKNGFNLDHIELGLQTEVDPYFRAWTTLAFEDGEPVEVEEAVIQSTNLSNGFTLSAGKFKSGIGRLNRQHNHVWDFMDAPLVYDKFLGSHGLTEKGLQLTWLAPTSQYLLLGAEIANGENEGFCSYIGENGLPKHNAPRLYTAFLKYSPNLKTNQSLQLGLSYARTRTQEAEKDPDTNEEYLYDGHNSLYGFDFIYKKHGMGDKGKGDFTLQGEYFYRNKKMDLLGTSEKFTSKHDGFYIQSLYGIAPRWRIGARFDNIGNKNHCEEFGEEPEDFGKSRRVTGMLDYKLSEYSVLRFQVARDNLCIDGAREKAWEYGLQLQVSLGSHPAHEF